MIHKFTKILPYVLIILLTSIVHSAKSQSIDTRLALNWLEYLSHDTQKGRFTGTPEHLQLGDSIANFFKNIGLKQHPLIGSYKQAIQVDLSQVKTTSYNIVGWIPGTSQPDEYIFITAHYDHLGTTSTNPNPSFNQKEQIIYKDSIFNGANDNATGTAAVISPVGQLRWEQNIMQVRNGGIGPVSQKLYDTITGLQTGRIKDNHNWIVEV